MRIFSAFDNWVQRGPFSQVDLALYRIIYSASVLCLVPGIQWLDEYPDSMYLAPPGPFQLLSAFPPHSVLVVLEILRSIALVMLLLGVWTKWTSIAVSVLLFLSFGITYTLGKIDHTIFVVAAPLVLAFTNWGDRFSIDSLLGARPVSRPTPQWPMRFFALLIGLSFFEAAAVKAATGWLELSSQAVRGHFLEDFVARPHDTFLTAWAFTYDVAPVWEMLDWVTVVLEFAILLTVPWWRAFRIALACATFFHLGVLLTMNIPFAANLVAYGAFVSWGLLTVWLGRWLPSGAKVRSVSARRAMAAGLLVSGACLALGAWFLMTRSSVVIALAKDLIVFIGALVGLMYLCLQVVELARHLAKRKRRSAAAHAESIR
jgi:hypothetical protein